MQAVLQGDDDDGIPQLDGVAAAGNDDLVPAGDAAQQQVGLQVQLSLRGMPVAGLTSWTVNSSASTRSSRMR